MYSPAASFINTSKKTSEGMQKMSECRRLFEHDDFCDYFRRIKGNILSHVQTFSAKMNNLEIRETPF